MNQGGIAGYPPSPYIVNLIELQNTINSASGLTGASALTTAVTDLQAMVDFQNKRINTNFLASYDSNSITVLSNMNFTAGTQLTIDGTEVTAGGSAGSAGNSITAGQTSIVLQSVSSPLIAMNIQRRPIFTFNQLGNAKFFDASGIANQFQISSARLIADTVTFQATSMGPTAGKALYCLDACGNAGWGFVSTLRAGNTRIAVNSGDNSIRLSNNNVESARFTTSGNLGIKTSAPATELDVNGKIKTTSLQITSGAAAGKLLQATDAQGNTTWTSSASTSISDGNNSVVANSGTSSIDFTTNGTQAMILNGSGQLGIKTTSPAYDLHVNGTAYATTLTAPTINVTTLNATLVSSDFALVNSITASNAVTTNNLYTTAGFLTLFDPIYCYNTIYAYNFQYISDRNQKNTIRNLTLQESDTILDGIQSVRFKWNRDGSEDIGFIAQDIQQVLPEAVSTGPQGLAFSYHKVLPVLVESVKGLKQRVASLEEEIAEIKRRRA